MQCVGTGFECAELVAYVSWLYPAAPLSDF